MGFAFRVFPRNREPEKGAIEEENRKQQEKPSKKNANNRIPSTRATERLPPGFFTETGIKTVPGTREKRSFL
jgi:hypothetical protein